MKRKKPLGEEDACEPDSPSPKKVAPVHQNRDQEISLLQIPFKSLADEKSIEAHFEKLADTLINDAVLVAGGVRHRIAELEFYYHTAVLPDPFPHGTDLQRTSAQWLGPFLFLFFVCFIR